MMLYTLAMYICLETVPVRKCDRTTALMADSVEFEHGCNDLKVRPQIERAPGIYVVTKCVRPSR